ncbi:MAG: hypothetical protein SP4CHLAM5_03000 [Chlamydiia bacterium]|nr:hypothetical protein [Chlamydiia bacterium]MCH9618174.1 hypothetical protein [Chlamydiia bacterium]MCH9624484.1 hypothetical protein [Chlamydiia bacterium]
MITTTKKVTALFVLGCLTATNIFADNMSSKKEQEPSMEQYVPPAQPLGKDGSLNYYLKAAYTLWAPYNNATTYGTGIGTASLRGNILQANTYAASGFKVGAGANLDHDGWHLGATYTWFLHDPATTGDAVNAGQDYYSIQDIALTLNSASSKYKIQFNRIDAMIHRNFYIGHYVAFRPWLGLLASWDTQNLNYNTTGDDDITVRSRLKQTWWGIGPYGGAEATYYITNHFGLYISSGASMLLTEKTNTSYFYSTTADAPAVENFIENNKGNQNDVEPLLEASLGVRYESLWEKVSLRIDLAWETQTYLMHTSFLEIGDSVPTRTNYSMQGLTATARVSF